MDARFLRLLFLVSLLIRLAFVWQIRDLPTQRWLVMDAQRYDELARGIAAGGWMPREVFYQAPLYPYFLALVYAVTGDGDGSLLAVRLLQAMLGAATVVLLAVLAGRLFDRTSGQAAGVLASLYGPAIFYVPLLLKSTLTLLALTGAVLLLAPAGRPSAGRMLGAGFLFGVSALLQENLILLVPFAALWLLLPEGGEARPRRTRLAAAGALALGTVLGLAPATLLNVLAGGEAVLTSSQGGMNFFIGNARGAPGTYTGLSAGSQSPESQREDARRMAAGFATRERSRPVAPEELTPGDVSALFWRESFRQIRADPAAWGRLLLRKSRLFWNAHEIPDAEGYDVYRGLAGPLTFLWMGFGIVAPLGLAGLVLSWKDGHRRGATFLGLLLLGLCLSVVLFFVFGRYRLPAVVLLIPPAGHALAAVLAAVRRREPRRLAGVAAVAAVAAVAVNLPAWSAAERGRLDTGIWFNLSSAALRGADASYASFRQELARTGGRPDETARAALDEAVSLTSRAADDLARLLALDPGFYVARAQRAAALHRRGACLASAGDLEAALASYEEARRELAAAEESGAGRDLPEAERQARDLAVSLDAATAQALVNLGARRIEAGALAEAEEMLRRAVALDPRSAPAHGNLGLCLLQQGLRAESTGDGAAAGRLLGASRAAFTRALELAGPEARAGEVDFYQRGLDRAGEPSRPAPGFNPGAGGEGLR
jgi:tetratricopeptide (TPR) repeat protein